MDNHELDAIHSIDSDSQVQEILLAASTHDLEALRLLLRSGSANVQDPETAYTPLHAAIAASAIEINDTSPVQADLESNNDVDVAVNGSGYEDPAGSGGIEIDNAAKTMKLLLQNGAIWNDVDAHNETPGCLARRLGLKELYDIMVDAGLRAEILLNRLDEYEQLIDRDTASDEQNYIHERATNDEDGNQHSNDHEVVNSHIDPPVKDEISIEKSETSDLTNATYLSSSLKFQNGRILDDANNGVMMAWETPIMKRTVDLLSPRPGLRILNVGHGMGIIDNFFQEKNPAAHHIIEAHPSVLARMREDGWYEKPNVVIHESKWQDAVPKIIEEGILFDAIYFDTFAEDYKALRDFFSDYVIGLLHGSGKWGFFNGLGADRQICYDVYAKVVEMDLFEAGFDTTWETIHVSETASQEWVGVKRKYWTLEEYKLPTCEFIG